MGEAALMDLQILRAKLYVPRYRPNAVPRSRLHERLDEGARRDLTVVSAPAGFGKTTLLADWSQRSELPVAWVSLDERDDDPARFLLYLITAIETIHEDFGETTRAFLAPWSLGRISSPSSPRSATRYSSCRATSSSCSTTTTP